MTKADKIFDIAEKLGYEGDTEGSTADAINAVSDALGFDGPHKGRITSALADLYTVVDGGGGGGVSLGGLVNIVQKDSMPTVGGYSSSAPNVWKVRVGDAVATQAASSMNGISALFAAGCEVDTIIAVAQSYDSCDAYVCTVEQGKFATVEAWDGTLTRHEGTDELSRSGYYWTFIVPELQQGEMLVLYIYKA